MSMARLPNCIRQPDGVARLLLVAGLLALVPHSQAGEIDEAVRASLAMRPVGAIRVMLVFHAQQPLQALEQDLRGLPAAARPARLAAALQGRFASRAEPVMQRLRGVGGQDLHALWLVDAVAAEMPRSRVAEVAAWPEVARVELDVALRSQHTAMQRTGPREAAAADEAAQRALSQVTGAGRPRGSALEGNGASTPWPLADHLAAMDLPRAWQAGYTGRGTTVAVVDSGVDLRVPDLARAFRGGAKDWYDPYGQHRLPADAQGHGSLVTSLLVGGLRAGAPTGVAPDARFIAARLFDDSGQGRLSAVHRVYQWLLDPDGDASTADAPQVVNNSWGFAQTTDQCDLKLARVWQAYRLVGIPVVFAAGNDGPYPRTSMSPANNPGVISVGALDAAGALARQSSRGPSACKSEERGEPLPFPTLHAPGLALPALDRMGSSMGVPSRSDGTSFAAALASGALLLMRQADPEAPVDALLQRLAAHASPALGAQLPVPQLAASLVPAGSHTLRAAQRVERPLVGGQLVLDQSALVASLPRSLQVARLDAQPEQGALPGDVRGSGEARLSWQPPSAEARLQIVATLSDGSRLPLTVAVAAAPVQSPAQASAKVVSVRRDSPLRIDLAAWLPQGADPKAVRWSQTLRGGRLARSEDGNLLYQPPERFVGTDQFALRGTPGGELVVRVTVLP
jgi:serine protease AprX